MIELYAFLTLAGIGYLLSKNDNQAPKSEMMINRNEVPSMNNIYDSSFLNQAKRIEEQKAKRSFQKAQNPVDTGVISGSFRDAPKTQPIRSTLADVDIPADAFVHNNMVPFFGSSVKQNVSSSANRHIVEKFTGEIGEDIRIKKRECSPMFERQKELGNIYGNKTQTDYYLERMAQPRIRNNQRPFEPVKVAPGLNAGYGREGVGGFQQFEVQEALRPKTVDDLRVSTNPKETYEGRVLPGAGTAQRGKVGDLSREVKETFYENSSDRYFTTTGAFSKQTERPDVEVKDTNRTDTTREYKGDAYAAGLNKAPKLSGAVKETDRQQFEDFGFRNVEGDQYGKGDEYDFGKESIVCKENERDNTVEKTYEGNVISLVKNIIAPLEDIFKNTRKEYTIQNPRPYGQLQPTFPDKITIKDPNDVMRTTIKETTIHDTIETGNIKGASRVTVYDPEVVARTTMRETTRPKDTQLNLRAGTYKGKTYFGDKAQTTMKETTIDNDRDGNIEGLEGQKGAYETTEYDAKDTQKQFLSDRDYSGIANREQGDGYVISPAEAPDTQKQFLSDKDYIGTATSGDKKQMSYEDIMNARINELKELTLTGRDPTKESVKVAVGKTDINAEVKKLQVDTCASRDKNNVDHIIYQQTTSPDDLFITKEKASLDQQDRLDINVLTSLQNNPYALKPLSSV